MEEYFEWDTLNLFQQLNWKGYKRMSSIFPWMWSERSLAQPRRSEHVFDASAKSSSGVSPNDTARGTNTAFSAHDVLLRFRFHRVALTTDVSRMYRAVELTSSDHDLHRFVWRHNPDEPLQDYRMTRVTFGVSASSFTANMSVKQNAIDFALEYPQAMNAVEKSFYVDDGLTGADSIEKAIELQRQLQHLFSRGGFLLRK